MEKIKEKINIHFEQKYLERLNKEYQQTLGTFSPEEHSEKERLIKDSFQILSQRLAGKEGLDFGDRQQATLKLKLARYFQNYETIDLNVLYDAIIESPKFINTDKGSLTHLFEVHEVKTLQKIAEMRKLRAEMGDIQASNPFEALFTTQSDNYFMARLLNMPHLQEESEYMEHCVGTSNSYINRMKKGEVEILSFRRAPKVNPKTQKLESDKPIITIEYNLKTKVIEQMKKYNDEYLSPNDPYFDDVIDALKRLRKTRTDTGEFRDFVQISPSELNNIKVKDYHILTDRGEVSFRDFNPNEGLFILKTGKMDITPNIAKEDAVKIIKIVENIDARPEELAYTKEEVTASTKIWIGELFKGFFTWPPEHIEHVYASFPEGKIHREDLEIGGKTPEELEKELEKRNIKKSDYALDMLRSRDFTTLKNPEEIKLIRLKVRNLGFEDGATTEQIYRKAEEFGLDLCPAEVGPNLRLKYLDQPLNESILIAMKQISNRRDYPRVFYLARANDGLWLRGSWAPPDHRWSSGREFVFSLRKDSQKTRNESGLTKLVVL